jgi:transposase
MRDTLAQYPRLRATRLFEMVRARGYPGSVVQLRRVVRTLRPPVTPTVYRRLSTLPAEEAQVDWGAFGAIRIGQKKRPTHRGVTAFVGTPRSRCARTALRAATALFVAPLLIDSVVRKRTPLHDLIRLGNWMRFAPKPAHI